jgi:enoyl-CoA hydratase/carnithine racemase
MSTLAVTLAATNPPGPPDPRRERLGDLARQIKAAADNTLRYAKGEEYSEAGNRLEAVIGRETARLEVLGAEARRLHEAIREAEKAS